jgi:phosphatidylserine/phosphatidylglycerophosphate/cardiolipin synthase-like enzyme
LKPTGPLAREVADEGVVLQVALADTPTATPNRVVIYDWFTRVGTPPRPGNDVEVLVDGEETWSRVFQDLELASQSVLASTWILRADHELVRPEALALAPPERARPHALRRSHRAPGGERCPGTPAHLGRHLHPPHQPLAAPLVLGRPFGIELLEQDHPRLIGSVHQKTFTIDSRVGYCGGMNIKENDWDTSAHTVYDPRRNPHSTTPDFRHAVKSKQKRTKYPPRHDLTLRIEGPAVHDLEVNFQQRWNQSLRAHRASIFGRLTDLIRNRLLRRPPHTRLREPETSPAELGDRWVQIIRTTPGGEEGILDAYRRPSPTPANTSTSRTSTSEAPSSAAPSSKPSSETQACASRWSPGPSTTARRAGIPAATGPPTPKTPSAASPPTSSSPASWSTTPTPPTALSATSRSTYTPRS